MKIVKNNYHTHIKLCNHAFGMPKDYVEEAIKLGMDSLGISDHNPVPAFLWGANVRVDECESCGERSVAKGLLNGYTGSQFMCTIMDHLGHTKKYGA